MMPFLKKKGKERKDKEKRESQNVSHLQQMLKITLSSCYMGVFKFDSIFFLCPQIEGKHQKITWKKKVILYFFPPNAVLVQFFKIDFQAVWGKITSLKYSVVKHFNKALLKGCDSLHYTTLAAKIKK